MFSKAVRQSGLAKHHHPMIRLGDWLGARVALPVVGVLKPATMFRQR